jgi:hypothetical protein
MGGVLAALDGVGWATVCVTVGRELFRPPVGLSPQATWPLGALLGGLVLLRGHVSDRVDLGVATGLGLFTGLVATAVLRKRPLLHGGAGWLLALGVLLTRVAPEALLVSGDVREVMRAVAVAAVQSAAWMALGSTYALRRRAAVEATALVEAARHRA